MSAAYSNRVPEVYLDAEAFKEAVDPVKNFATEATAYGFKMGDKSILTDELRFGDNKWICFTSNGDLPGPTGKPKNIAHAILSLEKDMSSFAMNFAAPADTDESKIHEMMELFHDIDIRQDGPGNFLIRINIEIGDTPPGSQNDNVAFSNAFLQLEALGVNSTPYPINGISAELLPVFCEKPDMLCDLDREAQSREIAKTLVESLGNGARDLPLMKREEFHVDKLLNERSGIELHNSYSPSRSR